MQPPKTTVNCGAVSVKSISGGVSLDFDRAPNVINAFGIGYAAGLMRHIAATGNYVLDYYGSDRACFAGACITQRERAHEFTGGVRVSAPLRVITPYAVGSLGALRCVVRREAGRFGEAQGSDSIFIGGGGAGFDLRITSFMGFQGEARIMAGRGGFWYMRNMVGVYFRHH